MCVCECREVGMENVLCLVRIVCILPKGYSMVGLDIYCPWQWWRNNIVYCTLRGKTCSAANNVTIQYV